MSSKIHNHTLLIDYQNSVQKTEYLRIKIGEARDTIHLKRREAKESARRYSNAEWAISLCNERVIYQSRH